MEKHWVSLECEKHWIGQNYGTKVTLGYYNGYPSFYQILQKLAWVDFTAYLLLPIIAHCRRIVSIIN
jgi:hypothetical protein